MASGKKGVKPSSALLDKVVAPGDVVLDLGGMTGAVRIGLGLRQDGAEIVATRAGRLRSTKSNKLWTETSTKRYTPSVEEAVIGVVVDKHSENFDLDIRAPSAALLPVLAFEGATRRNRPNLTIGSAVYARIVKTSIDGDPELSCLDVGGQGMGYGPLVGGYLFECSTGLARSLLSRPTCPVLEALGASLAFEMAVGVNGRVWVKADTSRNTILVANAILNSEFLSPMQQRLMVKKLLEKSG